MTAKQDRQKHEGRLRDQISRADKARRITEEPLFQDAKQATLDDIYKAFMSTPASDTAALYVHRLHMEVASAFFHAFTRHMETGQMSQKEFDSLIERERFERDFRRVA